MNLQEKKKVGNIEVTSEPPYRVALVGVPNVGKSSLYSALTGRERHVGNFPGVTVDMAEGELQADRRVVLADLPGMYALTPRSPEERISADILHHASVDRILSVVDAAHPSRGLALTLELTTLGIPVAIVLNMADEAEHSGIRIQTERLSSLTGCPVLTVSARDGRGLGALRRYLSVASQTQEKAQKSILPDAYACYSPEQKATVRYRQVDSLLENCFCADNPRGYNQEHITARVDQFFFYRMSAYPLMAFVFLCIFWISFGWPAQKLADIMTGLLLRLAMAMRAALIAWELPPMVVSLLTDGVLGGVGSVLGFLPMITLLLLCLALLEDSGYLARISCLSDLFLRPLGLSGRSFVPLLFGFGCTTTGAMACRILPSDEERGRSLGLLPFCSCSARLPVYMMVVNTLFGGKHGGKTVVALYAIGFLFGCLHLAIGERGRIPTDCSPYLLELPAYRLSSPKRVLSLVWEKSKKFSGRVLSLVFLSSLAVWLLGNFGGNLRPVEEGGTSLLQILATGLLPFLVPLGICDWRLAAALISGCFAKETVVSTLTVLLGGQGEELTQQLTGILSIPSAKGMLMLILLAPPCLTATLTLVREAGKSGRWRLLYSLLRQLLLGWLVAYIVVCLSRWIQN